VSSRDGFSAALIITLKPSRSRLGLSAVIHFLGLSALWHSDLFGLGVAGALTLALFVSFAFDAIKHGHVRKTFGAAHERAKLVQLHHSGHRWLGLLANGDAAELELVGDTYVGRWFTSIHFAYYKKDGSRCVTSVVIGADTLSMDIYRRLGVLLRLGHGSVT
jgi:hypothetical protein